MVKIKDCIDGDIIVLNDIIVVLVDNCCDQEIIFTALPNVYIAVESGENISYGRSDSGYENVSPDDLVKKIGHIELFY